ncbi:hypothetical protein AVEN_238346-1 [Araneus ventricosus]|uniref:Uncharacterized protein n=1 Tax=Araneus ventricosus TaxID=182803 RepID=A0A4Y2VEL0_ARAVE|nr:hypothetical protein AVEN_238346-1 [Araneus ventricosus]
MFLLFSIYSSLTDIDKAYFFASTNHLQETIVVKNGGAQRTKEVPHSLLYPSVLWKFPLKLTSMLVLQMGADEFHADHSTERMQ